MNKAKGCLAFFLVSFIVPMLVAAEECRYTCQLERRRGQGSAAPPRKTRRKPRVKTKFSFMPETQHREVREATLSVLDIFGQPVDEDEPMLMPLGGGVEEESSAFSPSSSEPRSSDPSLQSSSSDGRGGRAETLGSSGTLVHQYLKQNSQVDCASSSVPLKRVTRKAKAKNNCAKNKSRMWVARYSCHCHGQTGMFRWPDNCHKFVNCWRGRGTLQTCNPPSLVFNQATGQCDWPSNVACIQGDIEEEVEEKEPKSPQIDLTLPNCADYAALGYKCVEFWECSTEGNIVDNPFEYHGGEGLIDARIYFPPGNGRNVSTDPLLKACPEQSQVCCRGKCAKPKPSSTSVSLSTSLVRPARDSPATSRLCPSDYTGLRPIPGICTMFAECYKGRAYVKQCPPGTQFCTKGNICDFPSKITCDQLLVPHTSNNRTMADQPQSQRGQGQQGGARGSGRPGRRGRGRSGNIVETEYHIPSFAELVPEAVAGEAVNTPYPVQGLLDLARSAKVLPAPPSGQKVRLRRGKAPSEGYLQMFRDNRWGYVCDAGTWGVEEAEVICKQLGFSRGVQKTTQGLVHGKVEEGLRATERVVCSGSERTLEECDIEGMGEGGSCKLEEDIVSISCIPDSWATCEPGELPWANSCYSFHPAVKDFHGAVSECKRQGKKLLEIESQEENNMLSELLYSSSRVTNVMDEVWTGGVGSNIARKNVWFWHNNTDKIMEFQNWWRGWSGGDRVDRSSLDVQGNQAIKLTRAFPLQRGPTHGDQKQLTDYYFWELDQFSAKLPYICERHQIDIGCIQGSGADYSGAASRTKTGAPCTKWDSPEIGEWFTEEQLAKLGSLEGNNMCRNPDDEAEPWCLVGDGLGDYDICDIPHCNAEDRPRFGPKEPEVVECDADQFLCSVDGEAKCIPSAYVCDEENDCDNGEDEAPRARCNSYAHEFESTVNARLVDKEVEQWSNRNLEACLKQCIFAKDFVCRGVNYEAEEKQCVLLENNIGMLGSLEESFSWSYHERKETAVQCEESLRCRSGKCLSASQFCDGLYDCPDRSDENSCAGSSDRVEVRLVDGDNANEGRVEVRGMGHPWGGVCDDGFGLQEANVFCKAAGFRLGAKEAVLLSRFGPTDDGKINLDQVECEGHEEDLMECKFNPWLEHDCSVKEFAGVVCIDETRECEEEEWRCGSGECRSLSQLCDTVADCQDGSDESREHCDQELAIRLVGGNNVTSGRVEVRHHGQWGTICDDDFGKEEGRVVCKMLGFPGGVRVHMEAAYGEGTGPVWVRGMECWGNETSLAACPAAVWEPNFYCQHREDVGVECLLTEDDGPRRGLEEAGRTGDGGEVAECGKAEIQFKPRPPVAKVAGGQTASQGSQPWTASIRVRGNSRSFHWCGAVLVGRRHLLTAAHCVEDYPKETYRARVGDWDQDIPDIDEQEFNVQSVHFHPEFNVGAYLNNDVAVVRLKLGPGEGVKMSRYVKPACLPSPSAGYQPGTECTISGWGSINQGSGGYSRRLQAATVPILAAEQCMQKHVYGPDKLTKGMFCAGYLAGGVDSCQGDSGGPMVCKVRGRETLLGIISWGYGCGRPNKPGVYTR